MEIMGEILETPKIRRYHHIGAMPKSEPKSKEVKVLRANLSTEKLKWEVIADFMENTRRNLQNIKNKLGLLEGCNVKIFTLIIIL